MFSWWRKDGSESSYTEPLSVSDGTLNSTLPLTSSGEFHPSSAELPKTIRQRNQRFAVLGTSEVTTEPTTAPTTDRASAEGSAENVMTDTRAERVIRTDVKDFDLNVFEMNWNWVLPKQSHFPQSFEQDIVRVWCANAPPARRQPTAREHAAALLHALQRQPRLLGKWVPAADLESMVYPQLLACLGWVPRPWLGRDGVAKHLANLTRRSCKRVEVAGVTHNWAAFFVPSPGRETFTRIGGCPIRGASTR